MQTTECNREIKASQEMLNRVLTFIEKKYFEFNFDGLFGVILAQGIINKLFYNILFIWLVSLIRFRF